MGRYGKYYWALAFMFHFVLSVQALPVSDLQIIGNNLTTERVFYRNLRTRVGEEYRPVILNEDIKRLYELGLFDRIDVEEAVVDGKFQLTLRVKEKPELIEIRYEGFEHLSKSDVRDDIRSAVGGRFDEALANSDAKAIERIARDKGYLFAEASFRVEEAGLSKVRLYLVVNEKPSVKVGDIQFTGNDSLPRARLLKVMETNIDRLFGKGVYDAEVFELDLKKIQSYYRSLGFLDAKVEAGQSYFSDNRHWLYLNIVISEGNLYVIDDIRIRGNRIKSAEDLLQKMSVRVGQPYTDMARLNIANHIESEYGQIGRVYSIAKVNAEIHSDFPHVTIDVDVTESEEVFVEGVSIEGNNKTKDVVIRRELEFYFGEMINSKLIDESRRNLGNLGFFSRYDIDIEPGSESHLAQIVVRIEEKDTGSINFALGFSSIESVFAQVRYTQANFDWRNTEEGLWGFFNGRGFIGDGQNFSVSINTGSKSRKFNIDFSEPWVYNRKIRFGFGVYHTESSIADDYDETQEGFYLRVGKEFKKDLEGFLTYGLREHEISDVQSYVSRAIRDQEGTSLVSSLNHQWVYDGRDNRFFPTTGWYLNPSLTLAGGPFGGDKDFYKFEFEAKTHMLVFDFDDKNQHVLNFRFKMGHVDSYGESSEVAIFERFFAGGLGSVRGFANRSLSPKELGDEVGGHFMTTSNLEYSVPINERVIRGVFFLDIGNTYRKINNFSVSGLRSSVGVGLRLQIPALGPMPLALDFAKPIRREDGDETETFSFNFGNFF